MVLKDSSVEVTLAVELAKVIVSPMVSPEGALDNVTSCVISETSTVDAF